MPKPPSTGGVPPQGAFGWRIHPITGKRAYHAGEDRTGDGNFAPVTGTVIFSGWDSSGAGFGNAVAIRESNNPDIVWWIAHFKSISVTVGEHVTEGQRIGAIGMTGAATGVHTHTERRENGNATPRSGIATNPSNYYTTSSGGGPTPLPPSIPLRREKMYPIRNIATTGTFKGWKGVMGNSSVRHFKDSAKADFIASKLGGWIDVNGDIELSYMAHTFNLSSSDLISVSSNPAEAFVDLRRTFTTADRDKLSDIANKQEIGQALTSAVALVNEHADSNRDQIIEAIPGSSDYDVNLSIDSVPGAATGTATPA